MGILWLLPQLVAKQSEAFVSAVDVEQYFFRCRVCILSIIASFRTTYTLNTILQYEHR